MQNYDAKEHVSQPDKETEVPAVDERPGFRPLHRELNRGVSNSTCKKQGEWESNAPFMNM